jgi:uncharacterized surface protein with fasciclin (FAS1) repeats
MSVSLKSTQKHNSDLLETAKHSGSLKSFVAAIEAAALADMLKGTGPFTVFAPSDQAFESLPAGMLESLLKPEHRTELVHLLKNHVVSGELMTDAIEGKKFSRKSLAGVELKIDGHDNIKVHKAHINTADISASNGVIHVIDAVLVPPKA